jgi:hypothetical protein
MKHKFHHKTVKMVSVFVYTDMKVAVAFFNNSLSIALKTRKVTDLVWQQRHAPDHRGHCGYRSHK